MESPFGVKFMRFFLLPFFWQKLRLRVVYGLKRSSCKLLTVLAFGSGLSQMVYNSIFFTMLVFEAQIHLHCILSRLINILREKCYQHM